MNRYSKLSLLTLVVAGLGANAYAAGENDALPVAKAGISLTQAVAAAEKHVGGKAAKAEYELTRQGWAYDVEVVRGSEVFDVRVDAGKGTVISAAADRADHDDGGDHKD